MTAPDAGLESLRDVAVPEVGATQRQTPVSVVPGSPEPAPPVALDRTVLVATKLQAPPVRDQLVARDHLLQRLSEGTACRLTLVACPAGFGKSSLLAAWHRAESGRRPTAWLTIDEGDNDPGVLWSYLVEALRRACPDLGLPQPAAATASGPAVELVLPRLVNALAEQDGVTLILDDFHLLTDTRAQATIAWLVEHAPPSFHLVVATRREPDLGLASHRAHGDLLELRADDLRFSAEEAERFLNGSQFLELDSADIDLLVERTAGWPAGLYLAALSLRHAKDRHDLVSRFGASNRHVLDFLESEVLLAHTAADQELMLRCAVLNHLSGPVCDEVLELEGSAEALDRLSRSNLFLVPLDDQGGWYRFHPLFAQLLRVELERLHPGLGARLHRRAHAWYAGHGDPVEAIEHALAADMFSEAADHVAANWYAQLNAGRYASILGWLARLPADVVDDDVRLLLARSWVLSMSGQRALAAESIARAERLVGTRPGPLPDGFSSAEASLATLRAVFPWGNVREAHSHALRALELEGPASPWHPLVIWALARAHLWRGELAEADTLFRDAIAIATSRDHWLMASAALAYRSLIAGHEGRLADQARLARESEVLACEHGLEHHTCGPSMALGKSLTDRGRPSEAAPVLERAVEIARPQGQPLVLARALRYLTEALTALGRQDEAAAVSAEARDVLASCVDPASLAGTVSVSPRSPSSPGSAVVDQLTPRELTVLSFLAGDLSEADIGREMYVSHSTVHSHARSIYRKLGASSRAEALERAKAEGYL